MLSCHVDIKRAGLLKMFQSSFRVTEVSQDKPDSLVAGGQVAPSFHVFRICGDEGFENRDRLRVALKSSSRITEVSCHCPPANIAHSLVSGGELTLQSGI